MKHLKGQFATRLVVAIALCLAMGGCGSWAKCTPFSDSFPMCGI